MSKFYKKEKNKSLPPPPTCCLCCVFFPQLITNIAQKSVIPFYSLRNKIEIVSWQL